MNGSPRTEQLEWEARLAKPIALSAFAVVASLLAAQLAPLLLRSGEAIGVGPAGALLTIDGQPTTFLLVAVLAVLPILLLLPLLLFLYKAAKFRVPELLPAARVLAVLGAILFAATGIGGAVGQISAAKEFAPTPAAADYAALPSEDRLPPRFGEPIPVTPERTAAEQVATETIAAQPSLEIITTVQLAGSLSLGFGVILISLFAMRAGLLSRFMGYIGIALGLFLGLTAVLANTALPTLFDPKIIQMFWAGAIGLILLDRWPNGRGTAWSTGMAEPWPSAAEQRAAFDKRKAAELAAKASPPSRNGGDAAVAGKRKRKKRG
ncbi:MAG: hypothetical protein H0U42_06580 [Thermoleophilaceae bacterium]|nr:hypothetical protein [Thermoleophilaceae bacterium]